MSKIKFITFVVIMFGVIWLVFLWLFRNVQNEDIINTNELPSDSEVVRSPRVDQAAFMKIPTSNDRAASISDPRLLATTEDIGSGLYSITSLENETTTTFGIVFNENNGSFAIGLEVEPIAQTRLDAEVHLMQILKISEKELCLLNVFVGVPDRVNSFLSGRNLGVSFCPGAVPLE